MNTLKTTLELLRKLFLVIPGYYSLVILGLPVIFQLFSGSALNHKNQKPSFTLDVQIVGGESTVCLGDSITLDALVSNGTGPFEFQWYDNADFSGQPIGSGQSLNIAPVKPTTYSVRVTSSDDTGSASTKIDVVSAPTIKVIKVECRPGPGPSTYRVYLRTVSDTIMVFPQRDYTISREGPFSYWVEGIPSDSAVTIRAVFLSSGCSSEISLTYQCMGCPPNIPDMGIDVTASADTICAGEKVTLMATGNSSVPPYNYEWFDNPGYLGAPISTDASFSVFPTANTTYYAISRSVCDYAVDSVSVFVNPVPDIEIISRVCDPANNTYCVTFRTNGDSVSVDQGFDIMETADSFAVCNIPIGTPVNIKAVFVQTGCEASVTVALNECMVDCPFDLSADIIMDTMICIGGSAIMEANITGGKAPYTIEWFDEPGFSGTPFSSDPVVTVSPTEDQTYYLKVTNSCDNTMAFDSALVTVGMVPEIMVLDTFCEFDKQTYCVRVQTNGDMVMTLPRPYRENFIELTPDENYAIFEICGIPSDSMVSIASVFLRTGCLSKVYVTKSCPVSPPCPTAVSITSDKTEVCADGADCATLFANATGDNPPFTYKWFDNAQFIGPPIGMGPSIQVCPTQPTIYYVVANNESEDCPEPVVDSIQISTLPIPNITVIGSECEEGNTTYCTAIITDGELNRITPNVGSIENQGNGVYIICGVPIGTSIEVEVIHPDSDCTNSIVIDLNECPSCLLNVAISSTANELCAGDCATLSAIVTGSNPPFMIQWFDNPQFQGNPLGTGNQLEVCPLVSTTYFALVDDTSTPECNNEPVFDSFTIRVNEKPVIIIDSIACLSGQQNQVDIIFTTNADSIVVSSGSLSPPNGQTYTLTAALGQTVEIKGFFNGNNCDTTVVINTSEDCQCLNSDLSVTINGTLPENLCLSEDRPSFVLDLAAIPTGGTAPYQVKWFRNASGSGTSFSDLLTVSETVSDSITYLVVVTDANGCPAETTFKVPAKKAPVISDLQLICGADSTLYEVTGNTTGASITVNAGQASDVDAGGNFTVSNIPTTIALEVTAFSSDLECTNTETINPRELCCFPKEDKVVVRANRYCIIRGDTTQLFVENCPDCKYSWSPSGSLTTPADIFNPIANPTSTTTYTVAVTDQFGCPITQHDIEIVVTGCGPENIFLPNAFSPNGDNVNDKLVLQLFNVNKVNLLLYSRVGQEITNFNWTLPVGAAPDRGEDGQKPIKLEVWDGKVRGREQSPSVYGYYLEATCINAGTPIIYKSKGNVTLLK